MAAAVVAAVGSAGERPDEPEQVRTFELGVKLCAAYGPVFNSSAGIWDSAEKTVDYWRRAAGEVASRLDKLAATAPGAKVSC